MKLRTEIRLEDGSTTVVEFEHVDGWLVPTTDVVLHAGQKVGIRPVGPPPPPSPPPCKHSVRTLRLVCDRCGNYDRDD